MSMICWVLGLTPAQISALQAMPSLASDAALTAHIDRQMARIDELMERMSPEQRKQFGAEYRAMLEGNVTAKEARARVAALGPFEQALGLEKSWHILHYLFTGHVGPASAPGDLLLTGQPLGRDAGYGPARLHGPAETRDFCRFLEMQDLARLQARLDFKEMARLGVLYSIRIAPASEADERELRNEVNHYFPLLRDYVRKMTDKGNGLLVSLS